MYPDLFHRVLLPIKAILCGERFVDLLFFCAFSPFSMLSQSGVRLSEPDLMAQSLGSSGQFGLGQGEDGMYNVRF